MSYSKPDTRNDAARMCLAIKEEFGTECALFTFGGDMYFEEWFHIEKKNLQKVAKRLLQAIDLEGSNAVALHMAKYPLDLTLRPDIIWMLIWEVYNLRECGLRLFAETDAMGRRINMERVNRVSAIATASEECRPMVAAEPKECSGGSDTHVDMLYANVLCTASEECRPMVAAAPEECSGGLDIHVDMLYANVLCTASEECSTVVLDMFHTGNQVDSDLVECSNILGTNMDSVCAAKQYVTVFEECSTVLLDKHVDASYADTMTLQYAYKPTTVLNEGECSNELDTYLDTLSLHVLCTAPEECSVIVLDMELPYANAPTVVCTPVVCDNGLDIHVDMLYANIALWTTVPKEYDKASVCTDYEKLDNIRSVSKFPSNVFEVSLGYIIPHAFDRENSKLCGC